MQKKIVSDWLNVKRYTNKTLKYSKIVNFFKNILENFYILGNVYKMVSWTFSHEKGLYKLASYKHIYMCVNIFLKHLLLNATSRPYQLRTSTTRTVTVSSMTYRIGESLWMNRFLWLFFCLLCIILFGVEISNIYFEFDLLI